jgi:hypothetical protein
LEKNREIRLTFLDYDAVPWNNNNAEHAVKACALLRPIFSATSRVRWMRQDADCLPGAIHGRVRA